MEGRKKSIEIKFFKAWLSFFLIATLGGFIVGALAGFLNAIILGMMRLSPESISKLSGVLGFILGTIISFFIYRWSIEKYVLPQVVDRDG